MSDTQAKNDPKNLQTAIDKILFEMDAVDPASDKYAKLTEQLEKLYKIQISTKPERVSKDALVGVGGSLAGIIAIILFEKNNILTSKALGFVSKIRI